MLQVPCQSTKQVSKLCSIRVEIKGKFRSTSTWKVHQCWKGSSIQICLWMMCQDSVEVLKKWQQGKHLFRKSNLPMIRIHWRFWLRLRSPDLSWTISTLLMRTMMLWLWEIQVLLRQIVQWSVHRLINFFSTEQIAETVSKSNSNGLVSFSKMPRWTTRPLEINLRSFCSKLIDSNFS